MAAAAWSCVENMLQELHWTCVNHDRGARSFIPRPFTVGNLGLALTQVKEEQKKLSSGEQRQVHGGEHGGQGWARWGGGGGGQA